MEKLGRQAATAYISETLAAKGSCAKVYSET